MINKILSIFLFAMILSCQTYRKTKHGYKISGETKIVFNETDKSLNGESLITGYVYSRDTKKFLGKAEVLIGQKYTLTDKNGFFSLKIKPGVYDIKTNYVGNIEEKLEKFELKKNNRIIVIFELGTSVLY